MRISLWDLAVALGSLASLILGWKQLGWRAAPLIGSTLVAGLYGSRVLGGLLYAGASPLGPIWATALTTRYFAEYRHASVLGGLVFGLAFGCMASKLLQLSPIDAMGSITPGIALGQSIGRVQCLQAGCCFGAPTDLPWGMRFPFHTRAGFLSGPIALHPTQLYEAILDGALFLALGWQVRRGDARRALAIYLVGYGAIRFVVEIFRADSRLGFSGLTAAQWLGLLFAGLGFAQWLHDRGKTLERRNG